MSNRFVFIVGAGQSGATLLYKLLALHPEVGFFSNYDERLPPWLPAGLLIALIRPLPALKKAAWFGSNSGAFFFVKPPWLTRLLPRPAEAEMIYRGCGLPECPDPDYILFPRNRELLRRRFGRSRRWSGCRIFICKRSANNLRIKLLIEAFPQARFIHIVRDGRAVAHALSRLHWWATHKTWWSGQTPRTMEKLGIEPMATCAQNWVQDLRAVREGLQAVPQKQVYELRYEDLVASTSEVLPDILRYLQLNDDIAFRNQWQSLKLKNLSDAWRTVWDTRTLNTVMEEQRELLTAYGYTLGTSE